MTIVTICSSFMGGVNVKYKRVLAVIVGAGLFAGGYLSGRSGSYDVVAEAKNIDPKPVDIVSIDKGVSEEVEYSTRYIANREKEVGYKEVVQEGKNGSVITYTVDGEEREVVDPPTTEVIEVGTLETVKVETEYESIVKENPDKWDNYKEVTQQGSNKIENVTMSYDVDSETGEMIGSSVQEVSRDVVQEGSDEVCEVGTKEPNWVQVTDTGAPISFGVAYEAVDDGSLGFKEQKVKSSGTPGSISSIYEVACDDEGNEIPGYERREVTDNLVVEPINEVRQVGTFNDEEVSVPRETKYVGVEKEKGYTNIKLEGLDGLSRITSVFKLNVDGTIGDPIKQTEKVLKASSPKVVEVGTLETKEEEVDPDVTYKYDDTKPASFEEVLEEGEKGLDLVTYKYSVKEDSGELSNPKEINRETKTKGKDRVVLKGSLKPENMEFLGVSTELESYDDSYSYVLFKDYCGNLVAEDEEDLRSKIDSVLQIKDIYGNNMSYTIETDDSLYGGWITGNMKVTLHVIGKKSHDIELYILS